MNLLALTLAVSSPLLQGGATTFYLSNAGDDRSDGTHPNRAWRSLDRLSKAQLKPGDKVLLSGGQNFNGTLVIESSGSDDRPIVFESVGGRATIASGDKSGDKSGIVLRASNVVLKNLNLQGNATEYGGSNGLTLEGSDKQPFKNITIDSLDTSKFGKDGISVSGDTTAPFRNGFSNVKILRTKSASNYGNGLFVWDSVPAEKRLNTYAHKDFLIQDSEFNENLGGNGVIFSGVDRALFEFCRAAGNKRAKKVCLGMWTYCARNVTFRNCIASGTRGDDDGNGFDLDGGSVNCLIENCLSFDNDSAGYMHCDYPSAPRTEKNVIRDSVSINDGRNPNGRQFGFGFCVWGSGLYDCSIERNIVIISKPALKITNLGGIWASFIKDDRVTVDKQPLTGARFKDNFVQIDVKGPSVFWSSLVDPKVHQVELVGNKFAGSTAPILRSEVQGKERVQTLGDWNAERKSGRIIQTTPITVPSRLEELKPRDLPRWLANLRASLGQKDGR